VWRVFQAAGWDHDRKKTRRKKAAVLREEKYTLIVDYPGRGFALVSPNSKKKGLSRDGGEPIKRKKVTEST